MPQTRARVNVCAEKRGGIITFIARFGSGSGGLIGARRVHVWTRVWRLEGTTRLGKLECCTTGVCSAYPSQLCDV